MLSADACMLASAAIIKVNNNNNVLLHWTVWRNYATLCFWKSCRKWKSLAVEYPKYALRITDAQLQSWFKRCGLWTKQVILHVGWSKVYYPFSPKRLFWRETSGHMKKLKNFLVAWDGLEINVLNRWSIATVIWQLDNCTVYISPSLETGSKIYHTVTCLAFCWVLIAKISKKMSGIIQAYPERIAIDGFSCKISPPISE